MTKILEIESCGECPCLGSYQSHGEVIAYCMECDLDQDTITDLNTIPPWCPLPDQPKPITIETFQRMKGYIPYSLYQLIDSINAHFLGAK